MRLAVALLLAVLLLAAPAASGQSARTAALQVALRATGDYAGTVDGVARSHDRGGGAALPGAPRAGRRRHRGADDAARARPPRAPRHRRAGCMRQGMRGWDVGGLQWLLARHGFPSGHDGRRPRRRAPTPRCGASRPGRASAPTGSPARRRSRGCAPSPPASPLIFAPPLRDRADGPLRPARRPLPHRHRLPGGVGHPRRGRRPRLRHVRGLGRRAATATS